MTDQIIKGGRSVRAAYMRQRSVLGFTFVMIWAGLLLSDHGLELLTTILLISVMDVFFLMWTFYLGHRSKVYDGFILSAVVMNLINVLGLLNGWSLPTIGWLGCVVTYAGSIIDADGIMTEF